MVTRGRYQVSKYLYAYSYKGCASCRHACPFTPYRRWARQRYHTTPLTQPPAVDRGSTSHGHCSLSSTRTKAGALNAFRQRQKIYFARDYAPNILKIGQSIKTPCAHPVGVGIPRPSDLLHSPHATAVRGVEVEDSDAVRRCRHRRRQTQLWAVRTLGRCAPIE